MVTVAAIDVLQAPDLGPEGGSRVAAKDEADRLLPPEAGQVHAGIRLLRLASLLEARQNKLSVYVLG